jgi:hypothetical protein
MRMSHSTSLYSGQHDGFRGLNDTGTTLTVVNEQMTSNESSGDLERGLIQHCRISVEEKFYRKDYAEAALFLQRTLTRSTAKYSRQFDGSDETMCSG